MAKLKALKGCNSKTLVDEYGFSAASITRMEALLRLPPDVQAMVGTGPGQVPPSAAYEISRLNDSQGQLELAHDIADRRISRDAVAEKSAIGSAARDAAKYPGCVQARRRRVHNGQSAGQPITWDDFNALSIKRQGSEAFV